MTARRTTIPGRFSKGEYVPVLFVDQSGVNDLGFVVPGLGVPRERRGRRLFDLPSKPTIFAKDARLDVPTPFEHPGAACEGIRSVMTSKPDVAPLERQPDLFLPSDFGNAARPARRRGSSRRVPSTVMEHGSPHGLSLPEMAEILDGSDDYRVLRRLMPRSVVPLVLPVPLGTRIGVILDTETTGLDQSRDEVIELGMVAFTYADGRIGDVIGVFSALREPTVEISAEITKITGITAAMVEGQRIDQDEVAAFVENADLVIAHNAKFDRAFCERLAPGFHYKPWACSVSEVDWSSLGLEGTKLGYLVGQCGWFHNGHRAVDDCHALLEVLAFSSRTEEPHPFTQLTASAERTRLRVWAEGSPFHTKDLLKGRGYRWSDGTDARPKCWWIEIEEEAHASELAFLREEIYRMDVDVRVERLTACERFKG